MSLLSSAVGGAMKTAVGTAANAAASAAKKKNSSSGVSSGSKSPAANWIAGMLDNVGQAVKSTGVLNQTSGGVSGAYNPYGSAGKTVQVGSDGKAPAGLKAGDSVKTGGGVYRITGVNADGSYQSQKVAAPAPYGYTDYDGLKRTSEDSTDYAASYKNYLNAGNLGAAQTALQQRSLKLGGQPDSWQQSAQDVLDRLKNEQAAEGYKSALDGAMDQYDSKADAIRDEIDAQTRQNIANLDAQRDLVRQAGAQADAAALQNYYSAVNPNGAGAEQRAALGLSDSGLTETAQIAAANAYQGAVSSNAQNVANQLAQIDLAIENARLTGDMQTAQELQSFYDSVLQAGQQNAANILAAGQWNIQNAQGQAAQLQQDAWTRAGLFGSYAGQQTLAGRQAELEFQSMDTANQRALLELEIQRKFGWDQAAADLYITQKQGQGYDLSNIYQELQNSYARRMM